MRGDFFRESYLSRNDTHDSRQNGLRELTFAAGMRLRETGGAGKGTVARSTSGKELADVSRELRRVTAGRSALDHHAVLVGDEEHGIALTRSARNLLSRHAVHK